MLSDNQRELLRPFATEIGFAVIEWNDLHEEMAILFSLLVSANGSTAKAPVAAWNAVLNDRTQREMLLAVAKTPFWTGDPRFSRVAVDVPWLVDRANIIANKRNDLVHAPLWAMQSDDTPKVTVEGRAFQGNRRATSLNKNANIIDVFRWVSLSSRTLATFTKTLSGSLTFPEQLSWPERPALPVAPGQNPATLSTSTRK